MALLAVAASALLTRFLPDSPEDFGMVTLVPSIFLIAYIFWTKRILEALALASLMGFVMVHKGAFFPAFNDALMKGSFHGRAEESITLKILNTTRRMG